MGEEPHELLACYLRGLGSTRPDEHAVKLLRRFGSVPRVLDASWPALWRFVGWRLAGAIRSDGSTDRDRLRRSVAARPRLGHRTELEHFLEECDLLIREPSLKIIYVDSDLRAIRVEDVRRHSSPQGAVDVSGPVLRGMMFGAAGFFLVRAGEVRPEPAGSAANYRSLEGFADEASVPLIAQVFVEPGEFVFVPSLRRSPRDNGRRIFETLTVRDLRSKRRSPALTD